MRWRAAAQRVARGRARAPAPRRPVRARRRARARARLPARRPSRPRWRRRAVAGRRGLATLAAGAVLLGAVVADARLAALDAGVLAASHGRALGGSGDAARAGARARAPRQRSRLARRPRRAAVARLRVPDAVRRARAARHASGSPSRPARRGAAGARRRAWPAGRAPSWRVSGRIAPLGRYDAFQRRRGAHAALEVDRLARDGRVARWPARRAGRRAAARRGRARAWAGAAGGGAARPGWCSARTSGSRRRSRTDFKRSGLAHLLAVSRARTSCCSRCSCSASGMALGLPLRARLGGGARARRALRAAGGRRAVDPARGRHGRRGARRGARRAAELALVRARPCRGGDARASTRARRGSRAGSSRSPRSPGCSRSCPRWREALRRARVPGPLADAVAVTAAATLATAPLMALHFEQVSLASLPANLVAAPAVAPVMWLGMGSIALAQVAPALCEPLNALNGSLLAYLEWIAHVAAQPPAAALPVRIGGPVGLAASYAARSGGAGARGTRVAARGPAAAGSRCRRCSASRPFAGARARRLASAARRRRGRASSSSRSSTSARATRRCCSATARRCWSTPGRPAGPILRRLREAGVRRLDALLLTHAQADHEGMALRDRPRVPPAARARRRRRAGRRAVQRGLRAARRAHRRRARGPGAGARRRPPAPAVAAAARAGLAARRRPQRPRGGRASPAPARSTCCCRPTRSPTSPASLDLPDVEALKVAHHGSDDPGLPALLARTAAGVRRDRGRARQHLRAPDAVDPRGARARCRRSCARTATGRCGCASRARRRGWSVER